MKLAEKKSDMPPVPETPAYIRDAHHLTDENHAFYFLGLPITPSGRERLAQLVHPYEADGAVFYLTADIHRLSGKIDASRDFLKGLPPCWPIHPPTPPLTATE